MLLIACIVIGEFNGEYSSGGSNWMQRLNKEAQVET